MPYNQYETENDGTFGGYSFEQNRPAGQVATYGAPLTGHNSLGTGTNSRLTGAIGQIDSIYKNTLGRSGTQDEYLSHLGGGAATGQQNIDHARNNIVGSREAGGYRAVQNFESQVAALSSQSDPVAKANARDKLARDLFSSLQQSGHDVKWQGDQLVVDGRLYNVAGGESADGVPDLASAAAEFGGDMGGGGGGGYSPVDSLEELMFGNMMSTIRPYEFGGFSERKPYQFDDFDSEVQPYDFEGFDGLGPTDPATERLVMSILENPESLNPQAIEMLKAKAKDELGEMSATRDEDLVRGRYNLGYESDSPFFAAERNSARRDHDRALVDSNRNIDIAALETNLADRLRAAEMGGVFTDRKFARSAAAEEAKRAEAGSRLDVANSREGNRRSSADSLLSWLMGEESLKRSAADSRANAAGVAANSALGRAGLLTGDRQFDANYQLQSLGLEHQIDEDMWQRYVSQFEGA